MNSEEPKTYSQEAVDALTRSFRRRVCEVQRELAYSDYNAASLKLDVKGILLRDAEFRSQSLESLARGSLHRILGPLDYKQRLNIELVLDWVLFGKHP